MVLFVGNVDFWHGNIDNLVKHTAITMGKRSEVPEPADESDDEENYSQPAQKDLNLMILVKTITK